MRFSELAAVKDVVLFDGAMGSELERHGVEIALPLWSAHGLLRAPHMVRNIHFWYLHAGADVLTTNTFRTNPRALAHAGMAERWEELTLRAVEFAFEARERYRVWRPVCVAGSIAPVEDCYAPERVPGDAELDDEHGRFAETLMLAGVDLLLGETIGTVREAAAVARACAATGREYAISLLTRGADRLVSGEPVAEAVDAVLAVAAAPQCLLLNCAPAATMHEPLTVLRDAVRAHAAARAAAPAQLPIGCSANTGNPFDSAAPGTDIPTYTDCANAWHALGARVIGGCCGTTPEYIAALDARFNPHEESETNA